MNLDRILSTYQQLESIKSTAKNLNISEGVVRKALITQDAFTSPRSVKIQALKSSGMTVKQIAKALNICISTVNCYLPYSKGLYSADVPTENAKRIKKSRSKNNL